MRIVIICVAIFISYFVFSQEHKGFSISPKGGNHEGLSQIETFFPEKWKVYYTTDGSTPNSSHKRLTNKVISLSHNSVFRFAIYDDKGNKEEETHTYIIDRKVALPIVCLTTEPANFFDSVVGIYAMGCCADSLPPYKGANFWKNWERKVFVEFYETNGKRVIQQPAGVKIFGGYSKGMPQKSLAIYARSKYYETKFKHKLFPDLSFKKYKSFVLRNGGGDMLSAHIRDVFATQLIKETGLTFQEWRPVAVYINGSYWGKYNMREKINEHFIAAHYKIHKDSVIIMRHNGDKQYGDPAPYRMFIKKLNELDLRKKEHIDWVDSQMDIDNYLLYNSAQVYFSNGDAGGNIRYFKSVHDTAKWRWIFYDLDQSLGINGPKDYKTNSLEKFTTYSDEVWPNPSWSTLIMRKLLENDSIKYVYINRLSDLLNTTFNYQRGQLLLASLQAQVSNEIPYHLKRWGISEKKYNSSMAYIDTFMKHRPHYVWEQISKRFELEERFTLKIDIAAAQGKIRLNSLLVDTLFNGFYFKEIPLFIKVIPNADYEFVGWKDNRKVSATNQYIFSHNHVVLTPIFKSKPRSPYRGVVMFSEIDAKQSQFTKTGDWVELYNHADEQVDVGGWIFKDEEENHTFVIPKNTIIAPKNFLIITKNNVKFRKEYGDEINSIGDFPFGINFNRDAVRLYDNLGSRVDEVAINELRRGNDSLQNWVKMDYRIEPFHTLNWRLESPSPGQPSIAHLALLEEEKEDAKVIDLLIKVAAGLGVLAILFFFVSLWWKRNYSS